MITFEIKKNPSPEIAIDDLENIEPSITLSILPTLVGKNGKDGKDGITVNEIEILIDENVDEVRIDYASLVESNLYL